MGDLERAANLNITKIVHAPAFNVYHPDIERDGSRSVVDVNVAGTANLLELARGLPLERFLYVSWRQSMARAEASTRYCARIRAFIPVTCTASPSMSVSL